MFLEGRGALRSNRFASIPDILIQRVMELVANFGHMLLVARVDILQFFFVCLDFQAVSSRLMESNNVSISSRFDPGRSGRPGIQ